MEQAALLGSSPMPATTSGRRIRSVITSASPSATRSPSPMSWESGQPASPASSTSTLYVPPPPRLPGGIPPISGGRRSSAGGGRHVPRRHSSLPSWEQRRHDQQPQQQGQSGSSGGGQHWVYRRRGSSPATTRTSTPSSRAAEEKRMSASLAKELISRRASQQTSALYSAWEQEPDQECEIGDKPGGGERGEDPEAVEAFLAQQWGYTLGAELAHHVVGVFKDERSVNYRKRWDSELAHRVVQANPWHLLRYQQYFTPPFLCGHVISRVPESMRSVDKALRTVAAIVSKRNELQHIPLPEDLYMQIRMFKRHRLMRHLQATTEEKVLHDFLNCDKFLADWFIGTPRMHRLGGYLLFDAKAYLGLHEDAYWSDSLNNHKVCSFLQNMLNQLANHDEWYDNEWPTSIEDLAVDLDNIEKMDEGFGPKLVKQRRGLSNILPAYNKCVESGLLTPAVRRFCSLPCALLENAQNLGLR